jgi:signal transduction histidine kinase
VRLGVKGKQVLGVTAIVSAVVVSLSVLQFARLAQVSLVESQARAELIADAIFHRAREVVGGADPFQALRADPGLRSLLESSLYSQTVTFAAIVDTAGIAVAHADPTREGQPLPGADDLTPLLDRAPLAQLWAIYTDEGRTLVWRKALLLGDKEFGSIRIGVSTLLIRRDLDASLTPAILTALLALAVAIVGATVLAQVLFRPIHVIRSGLSRLGRGEFDVRLDIEPGDEFGEIGSFFNAASAQLSANRSQTVGYVPHLESAVDRLEEAVAIVSEHGRLLFANPAMRALVPGATAGAWLRQLIPDGHAARVLAEEALASRQSRGPVSASFPAVSGERAILAHPVNDASGRLMGVMLNARNVEYLSKVQSTVRYSTRLAALGRLSAGVAHEVKNPLNAMNIHLELLRQKVRSAAAGVVAGVSGRGTSAAATAAVTAATLDEADVLQHVDVIATEIRRVDEVVQGFLKFSRPEDLHVQPVSLGALVREIVPIVQPEADRAGVRLHVDCDLAPDINADPSILRQAFLNLAINACQAMPDGGELTIAGRAGEGGRVEVTFTDTGVGIPPDSLQKIFDLYFTTKARGSGIGLSMVFRTVQMHDGDIEVQSTPGAGTTFKLLLPRA